MFLEEKLARKCKPEATFNQVEEDTKKQYLSDYFEKEADRFVSLFLPPAYERGSDDDFHQLIEATKSAIAHVSGLIMVMTDCNNMFGVSQNSEWHNQGQQILKILKSRL